MRGDIPQALRHAGRQCGGHWHYIPSYAPPDAATGASANVTPFWMVGGTGAEVEVDTETGHVRVTRLVNVADAGVPLNPDVARTQLSGAAIMQLGFTLQEKMEFDGGQVTNASLADYKIPGIHDIPPMEGELVAAEQHNGPFGAKGLGESGTFGVSPAIANAIHDATGVRLTELPMKPRQCCRRSALRRERRRGVASLPPPQAGEVARVIRTCDKIMKQRTRGETMKRLRARLRPLPWRPR